ncbi:hypothetical protein GCM10010279_28530 [Streptomyces mutabilis]|nr:hypothetical protein GCM10010279_28530 [Streptomyces mutabilis]
MAVARSRHAASATPATAAVGGRHRPDIDAVRRYSSISSPEGSRSSAGSTAPWGRGQVVTVVVVVVDLEARGARRDPTLPCLLGDVGINVRGAGRRYPMPPMRPHGMGSAPEGSEACYILDPEYGFHYRQKV